MKITIGANRIAVRDDSIEDPLTGESLGGNRFLHPGKTYDVTPEQFASLTAKHDEKSANGAVVVRDGRPSNARVGDFVHDVTIPA